MGFIDFLLKKRTIYLRIFPDKMEVRDIDFKDAIAKTAETPFSKKNSLISEVGVAEKLFREALWDFETGKFFRRKFRLLVQPMVDFELSEKDKERLQEVASKAGAEFIRLTDKKHLLSDKEIKDLVSN